jgi:hypothetical protein
MLDYVTIGQGRLTNQFSDKPLIRGVVNAMLSPLTDVENLADQVQTQRWIDTAIGVQLDGCGYIVGEPRIGRNDDDYRTAILFRIFVNTSNATPEDLIKGLRLLTTPDDIQYIEQYPATAILFTDGPTIPAGIQPIIQSLAPAAISNVPVMVSYSWPTPFRFGMLPPMSELFVDSDADYLEANGSDLQVQVNNASSGSTLAGIAAADIDVGGFMLDLGGPTLAINSPNFDTIIGNNFQLVGVFN